MEWLATEETAQQTSLFTTENTGVAAFALAAKWSKLHLKGTPVEEDEFGTATLSFVKVKVKVNNVVARLVGQRVVQGLVGLCSKELQLSRTKLGLEANHLCCSHAPRRESAAPQF